MDLSQWVALATSTCAVVAKEVVRCAPDIMLPRILLRCGVSQSSFVLVLDKLDEIGETAVDTDEAFSQLLTSNTICQWRIGHTTKRNAVIKKLHGRVKAYLQLHKSSKSSSTFFTWIARQCKEKIIDTTKSSSKKKGNDQLKFSVLDTVNDIQKHIDVSVLPDSRNNDSSGNLLHINQKLCNHAELCDNGADVITRLHDSLKSKELVNVEILLEEFYFTHKVISEESKEHEEKHKKSLLVAKELSSWLPSSKENGDDLNRILLRWIPVFSTPDFELLDSLFSKVGDLSSERKQMQSVLVSHCLAMWPREEVTLCQHWTLEQLNDKNESKHYPELLMRCFLQHSSFVSNGSITKVTDSTGLNLPYTSIEANDAEQLTRLALLAAEEWSKYSCHPETWRSEDWMSLIILVASQGRGHLAKALSTIFTDTYQLSAWADAVLPRILLNLYVNFPTTMNLTDANIREMLIDASAKLHHEWLSWSSPIDDKILSAIRSIKITTLQTQQQLLIDFIKKYPLFAIKHTKALLRVLKEDATSKPNYEIERGRRNVQYPPLAAAKKGSKEAVKLSVVHWGCSFSEPLWIGVLDILLSFPGKVIFGCGHLMGLLDVLNMYLLLLKTQIDVGNFRRAPSDVATIVRIKNKFSSIVKDFSNANYEAFSDWVTSTSVGNDEVGDLLISCNIPIE